MRPCQILGLLVLFIVQLSVVEAAETQVVAPLAPRAELLQGGEAALASGDISQALYAFERAASMIHAADAEMGLVRAYMQSGAYQSALSFAAHAAGAHRDTPPAAALYAWLLHIGGQSAFAQRVLDETEVRRPGDALIAQARAQLRSAAPVASGALLSLPWRTAPFDMGAALPASAYGACSGVLIDGGRHALAPAIDAPKLWVRDGLGRRRSTQVERRVAHLGLILLRLDEPMEGAADIAAAPRDPFAGSPGFAMDYSPTVDAAPAWPLLHSGFIGKPDSNEALSKLGIQLPAGAQGGPVFDARGRFTGIALRGADGQDRLLAVSRLKSEFGELLGAATDESSTMSLPADAIYQIALPITVQLIAAPDSAAVPVQCQR